MPALDLLNTQGVLQAFCCERWIFFVTAVIATPDFGVRWECKGQRGSLFPILAFSRLLKTWRPVTNAGHTSCLLLHRESNCPAADIFPCTFSNLRNARREAKIEGFSQVFVTIRCNGESRSACKKRAFLGVFADFETELRIVGMPWSTAFRMFPDLPRWAQPGSKNGALVKKFVAGDTCRFFWGHFVPVESLPARFCFGLGTCRWWIRNVCFECEL